MLLGTKTKTPGAFKPYVIDWTNYLQGDTVTTSSWTVLPQESDQNTLTASMGAAITKKTTIWLAKGLPGHTYYVTNRMTAASGLIEEGTFTIIIESE